MVRHGPELFPNHFDGSRYYNPDGRHARGLLDVLRWKLRGRPERSPAFIDDVRPSKPPPLVESGLRITMVNHATVLLQHGRWNILTDPIWSERASPLSWIGPRRRRRPGVEWQDLPPIDVVLLSHDHYDHLDMPTLRRLRARSGLEFVVPAGVGRRLQREKMGPIHELDWGEVVALEPVTVHAVPAVHFSGRGLMDRDRTLWCGYVLEFAGRRVYFAGDTAFGDHFGQIREAFGPPDIALLPIGAYEPRWFMSSVHMAPEEAVRAHRDLGAGMSIGIHLGTFQLTDEGIDTAKTQLLSAAEGENFRVLLNGESVEVP